MLKRALLVFLGFLLFSSIFGLGLIFTAERTILSPDFVISRLDRLDMTSLSTGLIRSQLPDEVASMISHRYAEAVIENVVTDLEPWIRDQAEMAVSEGYDYLLGKSEGLAFAINLEPAKDILKDSLWDYVSRYPPVNPDMLPPGALEAYFNDFYSDVARQMLSAITVDEEMINSISPGMMGILEQARRYIHYMVIARGALIAATAGLVTGIIFMKRNVRGATLWLGIPFLVCGVSAFIMTFFVGHLFYSVLAGLSLPAEIKMWLPQLFSDVTTTLSLFGIITASTGAALLIVSAAYHRSTT